MSEAPLPPARTQNTQIYLVLVRWHFQQVAVSDMSLIERYEYCDSRV